MFRTIQLGLCVAALFLTPSALFAASVPWLVNTNTNAVIFDDNFESGTVGNAPVASVGSWAFPGVTAQVTNAANAGFAAYEGTKFMQINRNGSQELFGYGVAANSGAGNTIVLTIAFRGGAGADGNFGAFNAPSGTAFSDVAADVLIEGDGTLSYFDAGWTPITQTYNLNAWNTAVLTHVNGTGSYQLSINGGTPEEVGRPGFSVGSFTGFYGASASNPATPLYFDSVPVAVPEPTAFSLAVLGVVGLVKARRRAARS